MKIKGTNTQNKTQTAQKFKKTNERKRESHLHFFEVVTFCCGDTKRERIKILLLKVLKRRRRRRKETNEDKKC